MSEHKIGVDQWVEQYEKRRVGRNRLQIVVDDLSRRLPVWGWLVIMMAAALLLPVVTHDNGLIHVAGTIALTAMVALGLNVVVGYAGLLDLGFVAFYLIGAYVYAYLSSPFTGVHLATWASLLAVIVLSASFGLLLGSPSLRLVGDYLAIVTLGFGLIFVQLTTSLTRVNLPGLDKPIDLTGGPNGIVNLDPLGILGSHAGSESDYYRIFVVILAIMVLLIYHLNKSRVGRAWRALREDELAAEAMGMPTRRLKLQAFAFGASLAGFSGALFAARQGSVFPQNFDTAILITIYVVIVLGGLGSLPGVVVGAIVIGGLPDILRNPTLAGTFFYIGVIFTLFAALKPRWQSLVIIGALALFGVVAHVALLAVLPGSFMTPDATGYWVTDSIRSWLVMPTQATVLGNWAFAVLIVMILSITKLKNNTLRLIALVPTLYMLIFVWETRLSQEPSVTRLLVVGVLLIVLMIYRPNGLFGQRRVEVV
jgi:branched-chain amino acid transport system permease protein